VWIGNPDIIDPRQKLFPCFAKYDLRFVVHIDAMVEGSSEEAEEEQSIKD
jgi:hypothetical protein